MLTIEKFNLPQHNLYSDVHFEKGQFFRLIKEEKEIATFINTRRKREINVSDQVLIINKKNEIVASNKNLTIGNINISNWKHLICVKNSIQINDLKYFFRRTFKEKQGFIQRFFGSNNFKFELKSEMEKVEYEINILKSNYDFSTISFDQKMHIEVKTHSNNSIVILSGLLLIEDYFDNLSPPP